MRPHFIPTLATYSLLALAGAISFILPDHLMVNTASAMPAASSSTMRLTGVVRDFKKDHSDFKSVSPTGGNGHFSGNVALTLGANGRPAFAGMAGPVNQFAIPNAALTPSVSYTPMITVLGSAINTGTYDQPVTMRVTIGTQTIDPFGSYDTALASNLNKAGNPRKYVHTSVVSAGTPIHVTGRSWIKKNSSYSGTSESHWQTHLAFSTSTATPQIKVLRNGDPVPNLAGFMGQLTAKQFVAAYVDTKTDKMVLSSNQVIYLFELGVTNLSSSGADFQDLVVLITLGDNPAYLQTLDAFGKPTGAASAPLGYKVSTEWRDAKGNNIAANLFNSATDTAGSKGVASTGGITSSASFDQWFSDQLGVNASGRYDIVLTKNSSGSGSGTWEYLSDNFRPIDNMLLGNQGESHNNYFTYTISATFKHHAGQHLFFEFKGADDAWLYMDGRLALDRGGIIPGTTQYVDADRMGLVDGKTYTLNFFYAQRQSSVASFNMRTSLDISQPNSTYTVTATGD